MDWGKIICVVHINNLTIDISTLKAIKKAVYYGGKIQILICMNRIYWSDLYFTNSRAIFFNKKVIYTGKFVTTKNSFSCEKCTSLRNIPNSFNYRLFLFTYNGKNYDIFGNGTNKGLKIICTLISVGGCISRVRI